MKAKIFYVKSLVDFHYIRAICVERNFHVLYTKSNTIYGVGKCDGSCEPLAEFVIGPEELMEIKKHLENNP